MKNILLFFVLLLLIKTSHSQQVLVAAHRGDWRNAPENSLQAVKNAALMGVDMVEIDLKRTSDSVIVIMHDETINRTTNGTGKVSDYTFAEIRKFGLRNGLGRVTTHQIPTLEEVMMLAKQYNLQVNLDKSFPYFREAFEICKATGTLGLALFKTEAPYEESYKRYGSLLDSIRFMPVINLDKPLAQNMLQQYISKMKPYAAELIFTKDSSSTLQKPGIVTQSGTKIWFNSLWPSLNAGHDDDKAVDDGNTAESWDWLISHGATIIQTDRPKELLQYLRQRKLHK